MVPRPGCAVGEPTHDTSHCLRYVLQRVHAAATGDVATRAIAESAPAGVPELIRPTDIAWIAALVDGEGNVQLDRAKYPKITVEMADKDLIVRLAEFFVAPVRTRPRKSPYKQLYGVSVSGKCAIGWLLTLYTWFGERRREQTRTIVTAWKTNNYTLFPHAVCHPWKRHKKGGLCHACFNNQ